jgi:hypothetical protein
MEATTERAAGRWGGRREGAGRKPGSGRTKNPTRQRLVSLTDADWAYLALWHTADSNASEQMRELLGRCARHWHRGSKLPDTPAPRFQPVAEEPTRQGGISLTDDWWGYLATWHQGNASKQVRALIARARRWWPAGPQTNPTMGPELIEKHRGS